MAAKLPTFLGGSADLAHSNMTYIKTDGLQDDANRLNRNIQFGVREFAMGTILNGILFMVDFVYTVELSSSSLTM